MIRACSTRVFKVPSRSNHPPYRGHEVALPSGGNYAEEILFFFVMELENEKGFSATVVFTALVEFSNTVSAEIPSHKNVRIRCPGTG